MSRRKLLLETIEDRILCDAAPQIDPAALKDAKDAAAVQSAVKLAGPLTVEQANTTAATTSTVSNAQLTDEQRAALESVVRDSTNQIFFEENAGQFESGVRYGFKTAFGGMLVFDDHLRIVANQIDPETGEKGTHVVDVSFEGSAGGWQFVPGGESGVLGSYQQGDGTALAPRIYKELTLRNVYQGIDLRLYSAEQGVLEFDWLVARAQDYEKIRINFTGQDGINFGADGSASLDLRFQDLTLKMPEVYQVAGGEKQLLGSAMVAGDRPGQMRYALTGDLVPDAPLVIDPNVAWSSFMDLNSAAFDAYLFAIAVNANGVYAFGWSNTQITNAAHGAAGYMGVNAGFAQGSATNQAYIYRFNNSGTAITAWTGTGIAVTTTAVPAGSQTLAEQAADLELFPDGRVLAAFSSGRIQIYSANLATQQYAAEPVAVEALNSVAIISDDVFYTSGRTNAALAGAGAAGPDSTFAGTREGYIIRFSGASTASGGAGLTANWNTYVGGDNQEWSTVIAATPDGSKIVFATSTVVGANYPTLANQVDGTLGAAGSFEMLVGVLPEQATAPAAFSVFSYLGGSGNEGDVTSNTAIAQVVATNSAFYVGGNTASADLPGVTIAGGGTAAGAQTANGGGAYDMFLTRIAIGGGATGFQSTYLGGGGEDNMGGIAFDSRANKLLVFGTTAGGVFPTQNTTPASTWFDNTPGGGLEIIVSTLSADLTVKEFASYIGGSQNDYLGQTGDLIGQGHIIYSPLTGLAYLGTTVHSSQTTLDAAVMSGVPGKDKTKESGDSASGDAHYIIAFNANTLDFGDAPATYENGNAAREAISATLRLGLTTDTEGAPFSGASATGDDANNSGAADDEDAVAALPLLFSNDTSYSLSVSVFNNSGAARTLQGWIDFNRDGLFQASEFASVNVPVNVAQQSVTLAWSGLSGLVGGQSYVRLRLSDNALTDNAGTATVDERSIGVGNMGEVEDYALSIDVRPSLSGFVYNDANNDGVKQGGEAGIGGISITLTGTDDLGNAVNLSTTTAALTGAYSFTGLRPSDASGYTITEGATAGFLDGIDTIGTPGGTTGNDVFSGIVLGVGVTGINNNFGELSPATLSGFVYGDLSNFGTKDAFENGVPGVTVTLTGIDDRGNAVNVPATTSPTGAYSFTGLRPSNGSGYTITETQPAGYSDGQDTIGSQGGTTGNDVLSAIVLTSGTNGTNNNFGESPNFGVTKSLQATSVAGTTGANVAIGEVVTFRLVVTIPAGTFNNFQVQDALPAGFQFLDNNTAVVAFVSNPSGAITSTTLAGAGLQQTSVGTPTFQLPDTAVSTSSSAEDDTYASGTDVFFKLGNITNTDTTGGTTESVVIEFQAVVVNEAGNQAAATLSNTFSVLLDKDGAGAPDPHGGNSNTVTSTVVEPVLAVTKTLVTSGADAGDTVQYTITITNAGGNNATAYDISVADLLDTDIALINTTLGSGIVVSGATVGANTSTTGNLSLVLDSIAAGSSATVTLNAVVTSTAAAGNTVTNGTTVAWTSTPGANANERNGGGGINDYTASAMSANFVLARPTVDKLTPADTTYSIGETVTYDIVVTLPEGVTNGLAVTDNLPAGLDFVSVAVQTAAGGALANAFGGPAPTQSTSNVGNSYTFTFGATTTSGDNDSTNNSFLVRVTARVANVSGNQNAVTLTNTATLAYTDGTLGGQTVNDATPNVNITVVEPLLTLDKATIGTTTGLDAGDTVQYSITITNSGTATAHETLLSDALPAGLLVSAITSTTPAGGATVDTATAGIGTANLTGEYTIPAGGSITILYSATLQTAVTPNTDYINTATVTFTSVDGTALGQGTATGERDGSGGVNDYVLTDTAQVSTGGVLTIAKGVNNATPSIGDVLTYTVTLTLNEGTTSGIVITDTLPVSGDLAFVAGSGVVSFGTAGSTISGSAAPTIGGAGNNVLTFTLGTATIPAGAGANTVVLTYQVLVRNVATNQAGDVESNSAHVVATNLTTPPDSTTSVTLREPNVTFTKTPDVTANVDAGDVITYTIVLTNPGGANASTAFDALLTDTMPANLLVTGITSTTFGSGATADSAAAITGSGAGLTGQYDIPVGGTVTIIYTATVQSGFAPNGSLTNSAVLTWTSTNGGNSTAPDANERFGAAGSTFGDGSLNDYRRTTSATTTGAGPVFNKVLFSTSDANTTGSNVTVGETVTYALVVTLPEGTTSGFTAVDALPPGLRFTSSSIVTTAAASNGRLAADFNGTVPVPTVTGGAADGDDVTFGFAPITTTGDNAANNNTFLILVNAVVTDVAGNSGVAPQTVLANSGTFSGGGIPPATPPPVNVTVSEPRLQITKGVDDATADLGQTLTYTLTITHTASSTAAAYDLVIRDAIPSGLTLNTGSVNIGGGTIATNTSTPSQLALTIDQFDIGGTITITYTATVGTGAALGGMNQDNNVRLYWDTTAADTGTNIVLNGGTDGDDDRDFGAAPGYTEAPTPSLDDLAQDTVRVTVNANSISGFVYLDTDSSGTRNGAETGLGTAVTVTISGTTFFGAPFSQTVTADAATGAYTFTNVPRSDATGYTITETQPGAFVDGLETVGTLFGGTTSGALGSNTIANLVVPVGSGNATGYNFGELEGASVGGFTYLDLNNDGTKQAGEAGLGVGLGVTLSGMDVFGQAVVLNGTSDAATGAYSFAGLRPSDGAGYTIAADDAAVVPGTFFDGKETAGSLGGTVAGVGPKFDAINVVPGQNQSGTNYNFAEIEKSSLSGSVYADLDGDGVFDGFERGVPGVTITLSGVDDQGTAVSVTVTTDGSGAYTFANIRPSDGVGYVITEVQPADYLDGAETIGTPGGVTNNDSFSAVVLGAGVNGVNNNFGEAPSFTLNKTLVSTSEAGTSGSNVAIGEKATFRLVVTIPAGALSDFQVRDFLPAGYAYVNGSARAGLVGGVTSSTIAAPLGAIGDAPVVVLPDGAVSASATVNDDAYASGTDVFFKFGDIANADTTAAVEAVVIEFDAVVVNEGANQAGVALTNSFGVLYDRDGAPGPEPDPNPPGTPPSVTTTVVAPVLTFAKGSSASGTVSAGDAITYTLTIVNPGGANGSTAFDALVRDVMPADVLITAINPPVLGGGATIDSALVITGGGTGLIGQFDVPAGGSVTISYIGTVQVSAAPGAALTNNAELTWTSVNGGNSLAPDSGERFGAPGSLYGDGSLNDYRRIGSQTVTVATASFGKQLFGSSDPATLGNSVAIGELVTYALIVTGPSGTAPSLSVIDTLPAGLQFVSSQVVTSAAASNGLLAADFNGTVPAPTVSGGVADGDDVTFSFGAITVAADGDTSNDTFLILVTARVTDVATNGGLNPPGQKALDNSATFDIPGDGVPPTTPPPVTVNVVEAQLTILKTFNVASADAGDTVQITITVGNAGTGPAHDVVLSDPVNLVKFGAIAAVTTPVGFAFDSTGGTVTFSGGSIDAGASATFVFTVKLTDGVNASELIDNTAVATATSQPGVVFGERNFGPVTSTAQLNVPAVFDLTKDVQAPVGGQVRIGEVVTYRVTVRLVEGTTQGISLTDSLPKGMSYVAGSATVSNANGMTVNGFAANAAGQTLTITMSDVVNPGDADNAAGIDSDTLTITYQAVVNDVAGNASGTLLTNNLTGGGTGVPPSTPPPVTVTVSEPQLKVTKAVNDTTADLGQTLHFTLTIQHAPGSTADAFDLIVRDALPSGLSGLANITVAGAAIDSNNSTATLLDLKLNQLALGGTVTIEFDAVVGTAAALGGTAIDNNARVYWDSHAAEGANAVLIGVADGDEDRDYGATGGDEVFDQDTQDAQDTERLSVNANTISGVVYLDSDASGTLSGAESGLGVGVQVTISGTTFFGEAFTQTVMADPVSGIYAFTSVPRSDASGYTITETQPAAFVDGAETAGAPFGGTVDGALGSNTIGSVVVPAGSASGTGYHFGEVLPSSLSGFVYSDANNDGVVQVGEALLDGVAVQITGTDFLGQNVTISTTTAGGIYVAANLRPGTYTITETQPAGFFDGKETVGAQASGTIDNTQESNTIAAISLMQGVDGSGNNFGELAPASLSGSVFVDANNDGIRDAGEAGIGGVLVTLTGTDDRGNAVNAPITTQPDGTYTLAGLRPGDYTITETQPPVFFDGKDAAGSLGGTVANDNVSGIAVSAGGAGSGYVFGELRAASLGGFVFDDRNNDGVKDAAESGIGGVSVTLTGTDDLGAAVNTTVMTQPDGSYSFPGLRPGTYTISEVQPVGFLDGKDTIGTPGGTTADDVFSNVVLTEGTDGAANNFGELTAATLSGNVFIDSNNNGVRDPGESTGIVTNATLTGTDDLGNPVNITIPTAPDGTYSFGNLRPGTYAIAEQQPGGFLDGKDAAGALGGDASVNDVVSNITIAPAQDGTNYNFGELRPATLSGTVFQDDSNDGTQQAGEAGIGGVTLTLTGTDDVGNPVSVTTTSSVVDGSYSFPGLRPGTYTISETQPAGLLDGKDALGTAGGSLANDVASGIVLAENQMGSGYTFGELVASTFSGRVYSDLNNNGLIDAGESGIQGLTVSLAGTNDLGQTVAMSTTTDVNGDYAFANLRPGNYFVTEAQPNGFLDGKNTVGTGAGGTTVNNPPSDVISNLVLPGNTSATGYNFGELLPASLSGVVFNDRNNDGVVDPTDKRIANATVTLTGTNDLGQPVTITASTAQDGTFNFPNLRPGSYTITETQPAGYVDGINTLGTAGGTLVKDTVSGITLGVGQGGSDYRFAERVPVVPSTPDLYVMKTDNLSTVRPGARLTYVITGGNAGDATAIDVTITDVLPKGVRFVSASNGGSLSGSKVTWSIGDLAPGETFRVTVTVVVDQQVGGKDLLNTVTVKDRFGSPNDPTPKNNRASDRTFVEPFAFDSFNNFSRDRFNIPGSLPPGHGVDVWRPAPITPAPVYSGEADPGATLTIELFNANGERIGEQSSVVDSGGNWIVSFPSSIMRDYPASVRITELRAPYANAEVAGRNLRNFFVPAIHAGHFTFGGYDATVLDPRATAPMLGGLDLGDPFALGEAVKYNVELLPNTGVPSGR